MNQTQFNQQWFDIEPFIPMPFEPHQEYYGMVIAPYEFRFNLNVNNNNDQILSRRIYKMMDNCIRSASLDGASLHYCLERCSSSCRCTTNARCSWHREHVFKIDVDVYDIQRFEMEFESFLHDSYRDVRTVNEIIALNPNSGENLLALLEGGVAEC